MRRRIRLKRREFVASLLAAAGVGFICGRPSRRAAGSDLDEGIDLSRNAESEPVNPAKLGSSEVQSGRRRCKVYPEAKRVPLENYTGSNRIPLEEAIVKRRSERDYISEALPLNKLSLLLKHSSGLTDQGRGLRAAPSAGALYPVETYVVVNSVKDLPAGLYHYVAGDHILEELRTDDFTADFLAAGIGQQMLVKAQICVIYSVVFERMRWKYRERTNRYALLEAGHMAQNLSLSAVGLGLGTCSIGAFVDAKLNRVLGLDGRQETVLYLLSVGKI
jgi:SagB-type dehydrogenase family enzyme